jgi:hypothetical protein
LDVGFHDPLRSDVTPEHIPDISPGWHQITFATTKTRIDDQVFLQPQEMSKVMQFSVVL